MSPSSAKLAANASRTGSNPAATVPWISIDPASSPGAGPARRPGMAELVQVDEFCQWLSGRRDDRQPGRRPADDQLADEGGVQVLRGEVAEQVELGLPERREAG